MSSRNVRKPATISSQPKRPISTSPTTNSICRPNAKVPPTKPTTTFINMTSIYGRDAKAAREVMIALEPLLSSVVGLSRDLLSLIASYTISSQSYMVGVSGVLGFNDSVMIHLPLFSSSSPSSSSAPLPLSSSSRQHAVSSASIKGGTSSTGLSSTKSTGIPSGRWYQLGEPRVNRVSTFPCVAYFNRHIFLTRGHYGPSLEAIDALDIDTGLWHEWLLQPPLPIVINITTPTPSSHDGGHDDIVIAPGRAMTNRSSPTVITRNNVGRSSATRGRVNHGRASTSANRHRREMKSVTPRVRPALASLVSSSTIAASAVQTKAPPTTRNCIRRDRPASCMLHSLWYIIGGNSGPDNILSTVDVLDLNDTIPHHERRWYQLVQSMSMARWFPTATGYVPSTSSSQPLSSCVVVCGGNSSDSNATTSCEAWYPSIGQWLPWSPLRHARTGAAICQWNNSLIISGGCASTSFELWSPPSSSASTASPNQGQWTVCKASLPVPLWGHSVTIINSCDAMDDGQDDGGSKPTIVVFGGYINERDNYQCWSSSLHDFPNSLTWKLLRRWCGGMYGHTALTITSPTSLNVYDASIRPKPQPCTAPVWVNPLWQ
jgi:hypothetical protein